MALFTRWGWAVVCAGSLSCIGRNAADSVAKPPTYEPKGESKCSVAKSQSEPLVVEWPSAARAKLESGARKGLVVVAYSGCEMRVLGQCRAPGGYVFSATTVKRDVVTMHDQDELYANVPVGAAKLEGKLASYGQLNVSMTIVGRYEAAQAFVNASQLEGACEGATHVVAALTTGAFKFFAGADAEVSGGVGAMGMGAGAKSASKSELLNQDGKESACESATSSAAAPPDGCGAILRVEVVPLGQPKVASPTCPAGTSWDGSKCVGASVSCPSGSKWNGSACVGAVATTTAVAATPTSAQGMDATTKEAKVLFEDGVKLYKAGEYEAAQVKFKACYGLKKRPSIILNLANSELQIKRPLDAIGHFKELLALPEAEPIDKDEAREGLTYARKQVGTLNLHAPSGSVTVIDGQPYTVPEDGLIEVMPGKHTVVFKGHTHKVEIGAGQTVEVKDP